MLNTNDNYTAINLEFNYLNLKKYLFKLYKQGLDNFNIALLISLEKEYYEGKNLKRIIKDLVKLSNNIECNFDGKKVKFEVAKIRLTICDVLNRHRWIYRYLEEYMIKNNLTEEHQVPDNIKQEMEKKAYKVGKQQGADWFKNHAIDAINEILPIDKRINKDFLLADEITEIFEGNNKIPKFDCSRTDTWLNHPRYEAIKNAIIEIRNLPNSVVERSFYNEAKYFLDRLTGRNELQKFPDIFIKYSVNYIAEEVIGKAITYNDSSNIFEFYYGSTEPMHTTVFKGQKAQKQELIRNYMENELNGLKSENFVSIREKVS